MGQGEKRMVFPYSYIIAWVVLCAALPYNDIAGFGILTAEYLYTKAFSNRVANVLRTADSLFVSHSASLFIVECC